MRLRDLLLLRFGPAAVVIALHLGVALALLKLRPTPNTHAPEPALVAVRIPFVAPVHPRMPQLDASYWAPPFASPSIIVPEIDDVPLHPGQNAVSSGSGDLGDYLGCGLKSDEAMTADQRAKCDELRKPLYAGPGKVAPPGEAELALERHFDREKARAEAPPILPCAAFTNVLCIIGTLVSGGDFKMGSWADAKRKPENPLAQPVFPFRP